MTHDSNRIEGLDSGQKRLLLARLLKERAAGVGETFPLSSGQEALWFLYELTPGNVAYNVAFCWRVRSIVDPERLAYAILRLVERHPMLRCTFALTEQGPRQRIGRIPEAYLDVVDASGWGEEELKARVRDAYKRPFDLRTGPVFRAALFRRQDADHVLLFVVHHIVFDAWSLGVVLGDLSVFYEQGSSAKLGAPRGSYEGFVHWQREMLESGAGREMWKYWRTRLGGSLPVSDIPGDHTRPAVQNFRGATHHFEIPESLCEEIRELARTENATPFMVLAAAFHALLHRCTGQQEVLIGTPLAGRPLSEFEDVVGYFVNLAVIRAPISPGMSFRRYVAEMREAILGGLKHGDFPFREIVKRLNPVRDNSRTPLFQVVFNLVKAAQIGAIGDTADREAGDSMRLGSLDIEPFPLEQQEGQFDLDLAVLDTGGSMPATLKYSTDLFEAGTIARMAGHFRTLLEAAVSDPDIRVSDLPLLTDSERREVVEFGVAGDQAYEMGLCLHERFEAQVERTPTAVAATCEGESLSYDALNRRANRLAHRLQELGVGPDKLVGLCVERSLDLVIGILGILKAGGAYLPIDLSYPAERVVFMLEDAEAPVLVTQRALADKLPTRAGTTVYLEEPLEGYPDTNPQSGARPDNLIYVIYTSGSTGKPKGALITHHAVDRLFRATEEWYGFGPGDVWTLFHSVAFDFSVWEFWGALIYGGRLVVVPYWVSRSPEAFLELLHREEVTVLNQTPSAFRQLIQADLGAGTARRTALRYVIFGGEALELQSLRPWFEWYGDERPQLVNMYGITETCVHVTYRPISLRDLEEKRGSVIGVPIPDLSVYVLDPQNQPVPVGLLGEMYVGGAGLARGYLKRMELTAQRFVADPFSPGERLYRTGDLARWLEGGELEYLGRIDQQIKIRGFRVELGEIESVLGQHPLVRESVVVAREDVPGDQRLVGYVVAEGEEPRVREELRTLLKKNVPDYMVPSAIVFLEKLPLTSNGKVDLKALPAPEGIRPSITTLYEAPRNEVENAIATVWKEVLRLEIIGIHDNFFDLGGHSLLLVQVQTQLEQRLKRKLAVVELFQYPSIETLAGHLTSDEDVAPARERIHGRADQQRQAMNRQRNRKGQKEDRP